MGCVCRLELVHMCSNGQLVHYAQLGAFLVYCWVDLNGETLCFGGSTRIVQASIPTLMYKALEVWS